MLYRQTESSKKEMPFYFLVAAIFIAIISPHFLSEGMFMDGLIYSTVSVNLAEGNGTFWNPFFTDTYFFEFHEHPPLAFGIQSVFYSILGSGLWIEKIYSVLTFFITAFLITKIYAELNLKNAWFALLLWVITPLVTWSATNNMLENTMQIFTTLSVLLFIKYCKSENKVLLILSGISILLGGLTKGFFAFFPLAMPFMFYLVFRKHGFIRMTIDSFILLLATFIPLLILLFFSTEAAESLQKYLDVQVINSLKNVVTVNSRFYILGKLFTDLLPAIGIILIVYFINRKQNSQSKNEIKKYALFILIIGLCGVLPILISLKQNGFYIVTTLPLFAISLALIVYEPIKILVEKLNTTSSRYKKFKYVSVFMLVLSCVPVIYFADKSGRDKERIAEIKEINKLIPENTIIGIPENMHQDWSLRGYFYRYHHVSLDTKISERNYYLIYSKDYNDSLLKGYIKVESNTKDLLLFKKTK